MAEGDSRDLQDLNKSFSNLSQPTAGNKRYIIQHQLEDLRKQRDHVIATRLREKEMNRGDMDGVRITSSTPQQKFERGSSLNALDESINKLRSTILRTRQELTRADTKERGLYSVERNQVTPSESDHLNKENIDLEKKHADMEEYLLQRETELWAQEVRLYEREKELEQLWKQMTEIKLGHGMPIKTEKKDEEFQHTEVAHVNQGLNIKINLTAFSGIEPVPKNESTFEEFKLEMDSIRQIYSEETIKQALRRSLKGQARKTMLHLGPNATINDIVLRLEENFGNIACEDTILSKFLNSEQEPDESIVAWSLRLEELMLQIEMRTTMSEREKKEKLRNRFWKGLYSAELRQATRTYFDSDTAYEQLKNKVRREEFEIKSTRSKKSYNENRKANIRQTEAAVLDPTEKLNELMKKLEVLNKKVDDLSHTSKELPIDYNTMNRERIYPRGLRGGRGRALYQRRGYFSQRENRENREERNINKNLNG